MNFECFRFIDLGFFPGTAGRHRCFVGESGHEFAHH